MQQVSAKLARFSQIPVVSSANFRLGVSMSLRGAQLCSNGLVPSVGVDLSFVLSVL